MASRATKHLSTIVQRFGKVRQLLALGLFLFPAVHAIADEWQLAKVTGQVWVSSAGIQPASVKTGMILKSGQMLQTDKNARALLVHDNDRVLVGPSSIVSVPASTTLGMTKLQQQSGQIEFDVEKLGQPHLTVETPYLAAVVKGTHFSVTVNSRGATVAVTEGLVQVTDFGTRETSAVGAGQTAQVQIGARMKVTGVPPTTNAALPNGLFGDDRRSLFGNSFLPTVPTVPTTPTTPTTSGPSGPSGPTTSGPGPSGPPTELTKKQLEELKKAAEAAAKAAKKAAEEAAKAEKAALEAAKKAAKTG
jgi:hypothetical protein